MFYVQFILILTEHTFFILCPALDGRSRGIRMEKKEKISRVRGKIIEIMSKG